MTERYCLEGASYFAIAGSTGKGGRYKTWYNETHGYIPVTIAYYCVDVDGCNHSNHLISHKTGIGICFGFLMFALAYIFK